MPPVDRLAEALYGAGIADWLAEQLPDELVLPDVSADARGTACGDLVRIDLRADGRLAVRVEGCVLARASAAWMARRVSEVDPRALGDLANAAVRGDWDAAFRNVPDERAACVRLPWEALQRAVDLLGGEPEDDDKAGRARTGLACDACVHACRVRWDGAEAPTQVRQPREGRWRDVVTVCRGLVEAGRIRGSAAHRAFARFGRLRLSGRDARRLPRLLATPSSERAIRHWTRTNVLAVVAQHLHGRPGPPAFASALRRVDLAHRERVDASRAVGRAGRGLDVTGVKGLATRSLYPLEGVRTFKDLDYVAVDGASAFEFGRRLLDAHGFRMRIAEGAVFSLKEASTSAGARTVTGHFHLVRPGEHTRVEVDVSFPGLPIGSADVLTGAHSADGREALVTNALAHLLKHDAPRIKDLNDLFLLVGSGSALEGDRLVAALRNHGLLFRARLAVAALHRHYAPIRQLSLGQRILAERGRLERIVVRLLLGMGWPFGARAHFAAQAIDQYLLERRRRDRRAALAAVARMVRRLPPDAEPVRRPDEGLGVPPGRRLYLAPLVLFRSRPDGLGALDGLRSLPLSSAGFLTRREVRLFLCGMGVFLPTTDWRIRATGTALDAAVWDVVRALGMARGDVMRARVAG